jgi:hypothetical protein
MRVFATVVSRSMYVCVCVLRSDVRCVCVCVCHGVRLHRIMCCNYGEISQIFYMPVVRCRIT